MKSGMWSKNQSTVAQFTFLMENVSTLSITKSGNDTFKLTWLGFCPSKISVNEMKEYENNSVFIFYISFTIIILYRKTLNPCNLWSYGSFDTYFRSHDGFIWKKKHWYVWINLEKRPHKTMKILKWKFSASSMWIYNSAINHWPLMISLTDFYTFDSSQKSKWPKKKYNNKILTIQHFELLITQLIIAFLYIIFFRSSFIWGFNIISKSITSYQICVSGVLLTMCKSETKFHSHISKS